MKNSIMALLLIFTTQARAELQTVENVDLKKYLGTWFEIARYDHRFERGCEGVKAIYTQRDDGNIGVENVCYTETLDNQKKDSSKPIADIDRARGKAWVVDNKSNAKLKVQFFWPFRGNYWIIMLDENYTYAVVSEPKQKYLWILSRTPEMDNALKEQILLKLNALGFDGKKLIYNTKNSSLFP